MLRWAVVAAAIGMAAAPRIALAQAAAAASGLQHRPEHGGRPGWGPGGRPGWGPGGRPGAGPGAGQTSSVVIQVTATVLPVMTVEVDGDKVRWASNDRDAAPPSIEVEGQMVALGQPGEWHDVSVIRALAMNMKQERKKGAAVARN